MSLSRSPRKPSPHRQRALERRVARLERLIAQSKPEPVWPSYPLPIYPVPAYGWQRCPLCGTLYAGVHACWTYNPTYQPWITSSTTTTDLPSSWHGSLWANNEGSGGHLH